MSIMNIKELIATGRSIEKGLRYVPSGEGIIRMYDVYRPSDIDEYYRWKECAIRFLQLYYPSDLGRFVKYSERFEEHFLERYLSNMLGVLEACDALPSDKAKLVDETTEREQEINKVVELEQIYKNQTSEHSIQRSGAAFHNWHAAACVLFDKWFYPTEEDWVKFQDIEGDGNGFILKHEYDKIYTPYQKLLARLRDGRNIKGSTTKSIIHHTEKKLGPANKVNIFISYAHSDKKWLERLKKHLTVISRISGSIEPWEDTKLRGGDKWKEEITKAINKANVAILLVSTSFLASDFIANDELPPILRKAQEDGTRILPLIVAPCDYEDSVLGEFQAINSPEKTLADMGQDEAAIDRVFLELNKNIKSLI